MNTGLHLRAKTITAASAGVLLLAINGCASTSASRMERIPERPNVLLILADDLGWRDVGAFGGVVDTPNIDRLAANGMMFTQAYAPAPICSASRAAILTGKSPARLGFEFVTKWEDSETHWGDKPLTPPPFTLNLPLEETTIAEALAPAGTTSGFFGKWHVSSHNEVYLGWNEEYGPLQQGFVAGDPTFGSHAYAMTKKERNTFGDYAPGTYPPDELTDKAIGFIGQSRDEPFFLYLSHYYVHTPIHTRAKWLHDKYAERSTATDPERLERLAHYGAYIESLDAYVGQVLAALEASGEADETLIIFTSDNGGHPEFAGNAPLRGSKWNLYEGGIRVPMIANWPGVIDAGTQCDEPVIGTDILPTLAQLAGTDSSTAMDGVSMLPLFVDPEGELDRAPLVWHFPYYHPETGFDDTPLGIGVDDGFVSRTYPQSAIRVGDEKLLYFYEDDRAEYYDLSVDLGEQHDLSQEFPAKAAALKQRLMQELEQVGARFPTR